MKKLFTLLFVLAVIGSAFLLLLKTHPPEAKKRVEEKLISQQMQSFSLPDLRGKIRHSNEWQGKTLIINFWASWCPPCLREIPLFTELQQSLMEQGIQFIGIAVDTQENVTKAARDLNINYPSLVGYDNAIQVAESFGNTSGVLPYTVIVDSSGTVRYLHPGELDRPTLEAALLAIQQAQPQKRDNIDKSPANR